MREAFKMATLVFRCGSTLRSFLGNWRSTRPQYVQHVVFYLPYGLDTVGMEWTRAWSLSLMRHFKCLTQVDI
jgi:hypothetical protein